MRVALPLLVAVVLLALAGCSSPAKPSPVPSALQVPQDVHIDAGAATGGIAGVVVDEAIRPVNNASVQVQGQPGNLTTGSDGTFVVKDLAPGVYFISVHAARFLPVQTSAEVRAGEAAPVRVLLPSDNRPQPHHDVLKFDGFIQASVGIVSYAVDLLANDTGFSACTCTLYFRNDPTMQTIVYEAVWTETTPPPTGPSTFYWEVEEVNASHIESSYELSPILQHLPAQGWGNTTAMQARLTGPADWVELNQHYQMFVTLWYLTPAPDNWSFVGGDQ